MIGINSLHPSSPRPLLPRDFTDVPLDPDQAIGRGPERFLAATREVLRIAEPVGERQLTRPDDVATVEDLLRSTGDPDFRDDREPTGLFSAPLRDATRAFQRRSGLGVDGIVNPDGETFQALATELDLDDVGPDDAAQHARRCQRIAVRLGNLTLDLEGIEREIDEAREQLETAVESVRNTQEIPPEVALMAASVGTSLAAGNLPVAILQALTLAERLVRFETDLNLESGALNQAADRSSDLLERRDRARFETDDLRAEGEGLRCPPISL